MIADKDIKAEKKLIDLFKTISKILDIDILIKDVYLVIEAVSIQDDKLIEISGLTNFFTKFLLLK